VTPVAGCHWKGNRGLGPDEEVDLLAGEKFQARGSIEKRRVTPGEHELRAAPYTAAQSVQAPSGVDVPWPPDDPEHAACRPMTTNKERRLPRMFL
jgi:hypothetical protein